MNIPSDDFRTGAGPAGQADRTWEKKECCCFTGHRPEKLPWGGREDDPLCLSLKRRMDRTLDTVVRQGYRHFLCGMALGCDLYFGEAVLRLKERQSGITLEAAIPCPTQADRWTKRDRARYERILAGCDYQTMVSHRYDPWCMQRRDRYMVDHASMIIAVYDGTSGGTAYTLGYAMRKGLFVVDLPVVERTESPDTPRPKK